MWMFKFWIQFQSFSRERSSPCAPHDSVGSTSQQGDQIFQWGPLCPAPWPLLYAPSEAPHSCKLGFCGDFDCFMLLAISTASWLANLIQIALKLVIARSETWACIWLYSKVLYLATDRALLKHCMWLHVNYKSACACCWSRFSIQLLSIGCHCNL